MPALNCSSLDFNANIRFVSNYSWWLVFLLPSLSHLLPQEIIDIFEGVRDDQALRMAANLGFKGPLERQVMGLAWISAKEILPLESVLLTEAQWPSPYLTSPRPLCLHLCHGKKSESSGHDDSANTIIKHFSPEQKSPVINNLCCYIFHIKRHL